LAAFSACDRLLGLGNIDATDDDDEVMVVEASALMEVCRKEGFERGINNGGG